MAAVKEHGLALQYVKEQTREIIIAAIKQNSSAIQFVKEQTPEICLETVKQDPNDIKYITDPDGLNAIRKQHPELIAGLL